MPHDQYQAVREVAEHLKAAEATVSHWIEIGDLRAINIGEGWRIPDAHLNTLLRLQQTAQRQQGFGPKNHAAERRAKCQR